MTGLRAVMISLGCAKNLVDSECILGILKAKGVEIVDNIRDCDVIFINTCAFITDAKIESINTIFDVYTEKKFHGNYWTRLVIIGCLATRYKKEILSNMPEVDLVVGVDEYYKIGRYLNKLLLTKGKQKFDMLNRSLTNPLPVAYLKIGEGCSNRCAYCAIPLIRGDFYSYKKEDIIADAKRLISLGKKEITVIAQDPTRYGKDIYEDYSLENLMEDLVSLDENVYFRVLYLYPDRITSELIDVFIKHKNLLPYFDIPIQHSCNKILKLMKRSGTREKYIKTINEIRDCIPNAVLRTSVIVGFPHETDENFDVLKRFIDRIKFDHLGVFIYSKEEGTHSYTFKNNVKPSIAKQRYKEIMEMQQGISRRLNELRVGETYKTLIEDFDGKNYIGRNYIFAPDGDDGNVIIHSEKELVLGEFYNVKIIEALDYDLIGEVEE